MASYIGAVTGAVVGIGSVWAMFDLPVPATREYVNNKEIAANSIRDDIIAVVIDLAKDHRERLRRYRAALVDRMTTTIDPMSKKDLQELIEQADMDLTDVDNRISTLERIRGKATKEAGRNE